MSEHEKEIEYWRQLYLAERQQRLAVEDAYQELLEARRSERPGQFAPDWETELCQP